ncbi:MAG: hypothetical protein ACM3ML_25245 [Micromonosporaceae bacterium]
MQLVNARDVKNAPGRPKTDKLDAVWLAKRGMLRPSFVPPAEIRGCPEFRRTSVAVPVIIMPLSRPHSGLRH